MVGLSQPEFLIGLGTVEREVNRDKYSEFSDVSYKVLFDQKVVELLANNAANPLESCLHKKRRGFSGASRSLVRVWPALQRLMLARHVPFIEAQLAASQFSL